MEDKGRKIALFSMKTALIVILDLLIILGSYFFALLLRFDFTFSEIPRNYITTYLHSMVYWCVSTLAVFYVFRLYHSIWSFAGPVEMENILKAYAILLPVYLIIAFMMQMDMPRSYYVIGYVLSFCLTTGMRFSYRFLLSFFKKPSHQQTGNTQGRYMIIGAGSAGQMLIKELLVFHHLQMQICCVIDDNPIKKGRFIQGIEIVGNRYDIVNMAKAYDITNIIFAIPSCDPKERAAILNICKETNCKLQTIPGIYQLVNEEAPVGKLRDIELCDLLGREQVRVNNEEIFKNIAGKVVLVTGGGGSIGSELCRQIAQATPKQLIIFDVYENNAYAIQQELKRTYPDLNFETLIGSVRNTRRIESVMKKYHPNIVFHAAAHKHVPLMEDSPNEAIKNNVLGTFKTAVAATRNGVEKFVLISTDKAVNPTNIMGASKRICEMVVQMMDRQSEGTSFVAVRFGNVLGSNGSVIPLFRKQIAEGGPVTVTDKRIIRYFMTIPEAVSLVLQASYYAKGGEIFVLDMGEPVKIDDMARNLIRLSGFTPDVDIMVEYTGLRPGEKLYEEMLMTEEGLQETENKLIHIGKPIEMDDDWFMVKLKELDEASRNESARIREIVSEVVPTYQYKAKKKTASGVK